MKVEIIPKILHFKKPAGTSRGVYTERKLWYVKVEEGGKTGIGECAPLLKLSVDDVPEYETVLTDFANEIFSKLFIDSSIDYFEKLERIISSTKKLEQFPSIVFGLETALLDWASKDGKLWENDFSNGKEGIPINGLIWMGSYKDMLEQINVKLESNFHCIKLKIGAIDFDEELKLLRFIRKNFSAKEIELRVDANGAFSAEEALDKFKQLAELDLHSIEQPIKAGQWEEMHRLCEASPLPIALDEELIPCTSLESKKEMLQSIKPQYIILKPSLHGGIYGSRKWIELANELGIKWWITSALESNIGLNSIAQWCGSLNTTVPQGLGTGMLFVDNIDKNLEIREAKLWRKVL